MAVFMQCSRCGKPMSCTATGGGTTWRCESCGFEFSCSSKDMSLQRAKQFMRGQTISTLLIPSTPSTVTAGAIVGIFAWLLTGSMIAAVVMAAGTLLLLLGLFVLSALRMQRDMTESFSVDAY